MLLRGAGIQAVGTMGTSHWVGMGKACGERAPESSMWWQLEGGLEAGKEAD